MLLDSSMIKERHWIELM